MMKRSKNDQIDAGVLEQFAVHMPFKPWQRPSVATLALHALARRLRELVEMQTAEKNRQHAAGLSKAIPAVVRRDLARSLRAQERAIERLTRQARKLIAQDPQLAERFELLDSVPGIGETSAVQLLGELGVLAPDLEARQWVAYAGLDPRQYTSGTSVHKKPRISKAGNKYLRHALFMPALVAVMRKLLHALHAMFKTHQPYDGSKLFRLKSAPAQEVTYVLVAC